MDAKLTSRQTAQAAVRATSDGYLFEVQAGKGDRYRLAQVDDYSGIKRSRFPHRAPSKLTLQARLSAPGLPGTWGLGFWNDPFDLAYGATGTDSRLPALPQAAWFFHASPPNHLAFGEDSPAAGFFAGMQRSPALPGMLLLPGLLGLPFLAIRPFSRQMRCLAGRLIHQDGVRLDVDVTAWHSYSIQWKEQGCEFFIDKALVFRSHFSPQGPLALVLWIDNQYAAWRPDGRLGYGTLANPVMQMQLGKINVE